jgi:hypothetical protein
MKSFEEEPSPRIFLNEDELPYSSSQSFIVKIWLERNRKAPGRMIWRGTITHVPSGNRSYFKKLQELQDYFRAILKSMGLEE